MQPFKSVILTKNVKEKFDDKYIDIGVARRRWRTPVEIPPMHMNNKKKKKKLDEPHTKLFLTCFLKTLVKILSVHPLPKILKRHFKMTFVENVASKSAPEPDNINFYLVRITFF